jgi:hypothetical protein
VIPSDAGVTESAKSGDADAVAMVAATAIVCVSVPEVAERVSMALPATVEALAVRVMDWATPGVSVRVDG